MLPKDQLARCAVGDRRKCRGVDDFGDVFTFDDVKAAGVFEALEGDCSHFGHAAVVEEARAPGGLDAGAGFGDVAAGFTRNNQRAHG